jgi:hypothetical protein
MLRKTAAHRIIFHDPHFHFSLSEIVGNMLVAEQENLLSEFAGQGEESCWGFVCTLVFGSGLWLFPGLKRGNLLRFYVLQAHREPEAAGPSVGELSKQGS